VKDQLKLLNALHETSLGIVQQTQPQMLMRALIDRAANLIAGENIHGVGAAYWRCDHSTQTAMIEYSPNAALEGMVLASDEGLLGEVIRTGEAQIINDYPHWPGRAAPSKRKAQPALLRMCLKFP
jgi:hypothetical protein